MGAIYLISPVNYGNLTQDACIGGICLKATKPCCPPNLDINKTVIKLVTQTALGIIIYDDLKLDVNVWYIIGKAGKEVYY